jgi:dihydropteroate synthase
MGVLNITPDSFSDGGDLLHDGRPDFDRVRRTAEAMVAAGAAFSTSAGSPRDPALRRSPSRRSSTALSRSSRLTACDALVSVDTSTPRSCEAARAGAGLLNDVRALRRPGPSRLPRAWACPYASCICRASRDDAGCAALRDVVAEVAAFLNARVDACTAAGIARSDPPRPRVSASAKPSSTTSSSCAELDAARWAGAPPAGRLIAQVPDC